MAVWLDKLVENAHIEALILADDEGHVVFSSGTHQSERIASMLQAAEVIAQALTAELRLGMVEDMRLTTALGHMLMYPLLGSRYYLVVLTVREVPLMLVMTEIRRVTASLSDAEFEEFRQQSAECKPDPLDAEALIQAVSEWLRQRPSRSIE